MSDSRHYYILTPHLHPTPLSLSSNPRVRSQPRQEITENSCDLGMEAVDDSEEEVDSDDQGGDEADEDELDDSGEPEPAIHDGDGPTSSTLYDDEEQPHDIFGDALESQEVAEGDVFVGESNVEQSDTQVPSMDESIFEQAVEFTTDSQVPEESDLHGLTQADPEVLCIEDTPEKEKDPQAMFKQRREIEDKISELTVKLNNARKQSAAKIFSWFMPKCFQQKHSVNPEPFREDISWCSRVWLVRAIFETC